MNAKVPVVPKAVAALPEVAAKGCAAAGCSKESRLRLAKGRCRRRTSGGAALFDNDPRSGR